MTHPIPGVARRQPVIVLAVRILAALIGVCLMLIAGYYLAGELAYLRVTGLETFGVQEAVASLGILALAFAGSLLVAFFPVPRRIRRRKWRPQVPAKPMYGFGTVLAIGVGSTLGSPLFLLIPLNVMEYEFVSILSLVLAAILSIAMAKNNAYSYRILKTNRLDAVGGPAFVRVATGTRSARYFISRISMAVANTALAAYCILVFVLFTFGYLPVLLAGYGIVGPATYYIVGFIALLFAAWFVMNSVFEARFIRLIGRTQLVFTTLLVAILTVQSFMLGSAGGWNFRGLFSFPSSSPTGWIVATAVNTGYLYLLFFGFQEIQALDREAKETSRIPLLWRWGKRSELPKHRYFALAMVLTVVIAAAVNIFYALAVYAANPSMTGLTAAQIPALYVAETALGRPQAVLTALAFMVATFTTFVPAFMAASRHIGALGDDGFLPQGVGRVSWVIVLISIGFLAVSGQDFLVSVTDFMVLVSLGLIALSAIWLRRDRHRMLEREDLLALAVGIGCYLAAGVLYGITPSVAVFGSVSIVLAFLIYDVIELGSFGSRLFVAVLCVLGYGLLVLYPARFPSPGLLPIGFLEDAVQTTVAMRTGLLTGAVALLASAILTLLVRGVRPKEWAPAADGGGRRQGR